MLTYAGVAGAAKQAGEVPVAVLSSNTFSPTPAQANTGDTVVWNWTNAGVVHNVHGTDGPPEDAAWIGKDSGYLEPPDGEYRYMFWTPGVYKYVCTVHPGMNGEVVVTGDPVEPTPTPSPSPSPTASPTATATATPSPTGNTPPPVDDHTHTPAPSPAADTSKPALSGVKLRAKRRAARVTFKLSENATVTVQVRKRGAKKVLRTVTLQARAGTRSVVVRSSKLRKGRYTFTLTARDAMGNKSTASSAALRLRK